MKPSYLAAVARRTAPGRAALLPPVTPWGIESRPVAPPPEHLVAAAPETAPETPRSAPRRAKRGTAAQKAQPPRTIRFPAPPSLEAEEARAEEMESAPVTAPLEGAELPQSPEAEQPA